MIIKLTVQQPCEYLISTNTFVVVLNITTTSDGRKYLCVLFVMSLLIKTKKLCDYFAACL